MTVAVTPAVSAKPAPVKVAVVGAGYWGINHVRSFARLPGCELAAVCDSDAKHRERAAGLAPSARLCSNFAEVLADPSIEAVVLATPAVLHAEQGAAALRAGKHVLVEKPMALSLNECRAMARAARQAGTVLVTGPSHSFDAPVRHAADPPVSPIRDLVAARFAAIGARTPFACYK